MKKIILSFIFILFSSINLCAEDSVYDPLEDVNRGVFWFNDRVDLNLIAPVSRVYRDHLPNFVQTGVSNFFNNLEYPRNAVSNLLQFEVEDFFVDTGRFVLNTTFGVLGVYDFAKDVGLEKRQEEDLGLVLANWGVGPGPYLVLPLLGPSNVRDFVGSIGDGFLNPISYLYLVKPRRSQNLAFGTALGLNIISTRASLLEATDLGRESSLDFYSFMRSAYSQSRQGAVNEGQVDDEISDEDFEDDEYFDEEFQ